MADDASATETTQESDAGSEQQQDQLGDAGKKALEAERRNARSAAKERDALAARLKEYEERDKSETEKVADRIAKAEQAAKDAEARAVRRDIAIEHNLSKDDAELLDGLTDEDAMKRLAARLASADADRKKQGNYAPREGGNPSRVADENDERQFAKSLFAPG